MESKRTIILRRYQEECNEFVINNKIAVLAACPGAGKTEISIVVIDKYLKKNKGHRVLILPHSTNYLLANFYDRLRTTNVGFTYSLDLNDNADVHICLPQNTNKINAKYDFIIVDEAHENYLAPRVQDIIKKTGVTKQLLLTATPSKFIKEGGYNIHIVPALDLCDEYFAKLNIEMVLSSYDWSTNYNSDDEVNKSFKFTENDSVTTMENVMEKLLFRLNKKGKAEEFNEPSGWDKLKVKANTLINELTNKNWGSVYKEIGKTLIVCKSIEQSNHICKLLKDKGVDVDLSHSENDIESENVARFLKNEFDVLIVVNRARLGYSDDDLMNMIDLSGTHNPDMIYQMYARLFRGGTTKNKFYLKVTPKGTANVAMTELALNAALMLTDRDFISKYNGKNLKDIKIPTIRKKTKNIVGQKKGNGTSNRGKNGESTILPHYAMDVLPLLKSVLHDAKGDAVVYKMIKTAHLKSAMGLAKRELASYMEILEVAKEDKVSQDV